MINITAQFLRTTFIHKIIHRPIPDRQNVHFVVMRVLIFHPHRHNRFLRQLGIARITGQYELIPKAIAEKIQQRNEKRVVLFREEKQEIDANDPYAEHQIPDDLMW